MIDHYRRTRQERVTDSIEEQLPILEEVGATGACRPDQALAGREASEILQATLQKLSPDLREAVILRDLQEMEYREIAEVLEIPEGTVKSRINRGPRRTGPPVAEAEVGGMNCAELEILICDYVDGTLSAAQKAVVETPSRRTARPAPNWRATPPKRWRSWSARPTWSRRPS